MRYKSSASNSSNARVYNHGWLRDLLVSYIYRNLWKRFSVPSLSQQIQLDGCTKESSSQVNEIQWIIFAWIFHLCTDNPKAKKNVENRSLLFVNIYASLKIVILRLHDCCQYMISNRWILLSHVKLVNPKSF